MDHILSSCTAPYDALLRWILAKRKMIIQKYGTPGGSPFARAALLSDVTADDTESVLTLEDSTNEYDETEVSVPFSFVAFSSSLTPGRDLSHFWVIDSAYSVNLTAFRDDFATFAPPPSAPSRVGGVGVDVKGSSSVRISVRLASGQIIHRTVHALYTPTCHLALLSASAASLVSVGCNPIVAVNFFSLLTVTLAFSWCPHEWVCWSRLATVSSSCPTTKSHPHALHMIARAVTVPVLPSLPSATPYFGTANLDTLTCKAYMPSTPTVSQLAQD
jgi:hypothetical protein